MNGFFQNRFFCLSFVVFASVEVFAEPDLSKVVAQSLYQSLPDQNPEFIDSFVKGMEDAIGTQSDSEDKLFCCYEEEACAKENLLIKEQVEEADRFFHKIRNNQEFKEVVPNELYYRVIKTNDGKKITNYSFDVLGSYKIETLNGDFVFNTSLSDERALPLSALIPGLAKGMIGMAVGEVREIIIHPKHAFIELPSLEGQPGLIIEVKLDSVEEKKSNEFSFQSIEFPVTKSTIEDLRNKYQVAHLKLAYQYGKTAWGHYRLGGCSVQEVVNNIYKAQQGETLDISSPLVQKKLTDLHWSIYTQDDSKVGR